ncbi:Nn.00g082910.m01.CDS01 [Neocucurbitaria sp. VM-36]
MISLFEILPPIILALSIAALFAWRSSASISRTSKLGKDGKSKSVLITGCSEGSLGAALAQTFQARGLTVFATARQVSKFPAHLQELDRVHILELDVLNQASIDRALEHVTHSVQSNGLDVLVNSAGTMLSGPGLDVDIDQVGKECFEVNVWGPLRMMQAFSPLLVKATIYAASKVAYTLYRKACASSSHPFISASSQS